jgi:hypothetical protein
MIDAEKLTLALEYAGHRSDCDALGQMWDRGPCDCGWEEVERSIRNMNVKEGNYYRRLADDAVVKVLHSEVFPYLCSCGILSENCEGNPVVVYRLRDGEWPTRVECMEGPGFEDNFEGPLVWDSENQRFK